MSKTTSPRERLRPAFSVLAELLRTKPSSAIAMATRRRTAALTCSGRFSTLETVPTETPARSATALMPGRFVTPTPSFTERLKAGCKISNGSRSMRCSAEGTGTGTGRLDTR